MARNQQRGQVGINAEGVRAEMIDAGGVVLPSSGAAERAASNAASFSRLSSVFSDIGDKAARREGQRAGRKDAMDGVFTPIRNMTIRAESYDAAGLEIDLRQRQVALRQDLEGIFEAHGQDPVSLRAAMAEKRSDILKGAFDETAPDLMLSFDQVSHAYVMRADELHRSRVISDQAATFAADLDQRATSLESQARITGYDDQSSLELGQEMADFEAALEGGRIDGVPYLTGEKKKAVLSSVVKRVAIARAEGTYERLDGIEQKEQFVAGLKESGAFSGLDDEGRARAIEVFQNRFVNELEMEVTRGLQFAPDDDMEARLDMAFPADDDPLYEQKGKIYANAARAVSQIRKERLVDPAGSVARHPDVAAARAQRTVDQPETFAAYVETLLEAQRSVGITTPQHLPHHEARQLLQGVMQAEPEQKMQELQGLAAYVERTYGVLSDGVFKDVLMQAGQGAQITEAAIPILKSLQAGRAPNAADVDVLGGAADRQAPGVSYGSAGITYFDEDGGEAWVPMPGPANAVRPFSRSVPPMEARAELIQNPDLAEDFDDEYGVGSAASVLGRKQKPVVLDTGAASQSAYPGLERVPHTINPRAAFEEQYGKPMPLGGPGSASDRSPAAPRDAEPAAPEQVFDDARYEDFVEAFSTIDFFLSEDDGETALGTIDQAMDVLEDAPGAVEVLGAIERHPDFRPDMDGDEFRGLMQRILDDGAMRDVLRMDEGEKLDDAIRQDIEFFSGSSKKGARGKKTAFYIGPNAATAADVAPEDWRAIGDGAKWAELGARGYKLEKSKVGISNSRLEETLKFEELYMAYPELRDVKIVYDDSVEVFPIPGGAKRHGFHFSGKGEDAVIKINPDVVQDEASLRYNIIAAAQGLVLISEYEKTNKNKILGWGLIDDIDIGDGALGKGNWKYGFLREAFDRRGMGKKKRAATPFEIRLNQYFRDNAK